MAPSLPDSSRSNTALALGATASAGLLAGFLISRAQAGGEVRRLLRGNWALLSRQDRATAACLVANGQGHLLRHWPLPGVRDAEKRSFLHTASAVLREAVAENDELEMARLAALVPPEAPRRPRELVTHGDARVDDYYWLRDDSRKDQEIIAHLDAETAYCKAALADTEGLQEQLYNEMRGRIQEADQSAPQRRRGYYYYTRTEEGKQYAVHCRRRVPDDAPARPSETETMDEALPEEVLLDENAESEKHSFFMTGDVTVSPNNALLAYAADTVGGEKYAIWVKELATGRQLLRSPIPETGGEMVWANDNRTLFYTTKDALDRPNKLWRSVIGDASEDELVFHEEDDAFYVHIGRERSGQLLVASTSSAITSESRFVSADRPQDPWRVALPRVNDVEYGVEHRGDHLFILIRDQARPNQELLVAPVADPTATKVLIPHSDEVQLEDAVVSKDFLALFTRRGGLQHATVYRLPADGSAPESLSEGQEISFREPAYSLHSSSQGDFDSDILRYHYSSLTTPGTQTDYNMATDDRAVKKVAPVLGGFDKANYKTERLWATAEDGTKVPISLVYRPDMVRKDGTDNLLLYAYGAYGASIDASFGSNRLSLLDRGFVWAIAHVRGGGDMGRLWYENGKYLHKRNTFTDYIACAEHLIENKWTSPARLCAEGRSAGGLTMGAVVTMRPDLVSAVLMGVPFVDIVTTMLDASIPLTTIEWEEWGNPAQEEYYHYMKSYAPVDNIAEGKSYPNILATGGLHDPRVAYWEPAKFVAKLRAANAAKSLVLFKCDMGAGHFSQSGRFDKLKELAIEYAFLLKCQGSKQVKPRN